MRLWGAFATTFLGLRGAALLPPPLDGVLAWSRMFANKRTFSNYLGKLVLVCELFRMPTESLKHASVTRAGRTIKAIATAPLPKRYTRRIVVASLIQTAMAEDDHVAAWLDCFSYAFLLRVPSEALPAVMGDNGDAHGAVLPCGRHSSLVRVGSVVKLQLRRRKHRPHGSSISRKCWCRVCKVLCPVHCLGPLFDAYAAGHMPFSHMSSAFVISQLRRRLGVLNVPHASEYDTRCFRRGHVEEIVRSSGSLREVLQAGEWSNKRFTEYLNKEELEDLVANEINGGDSSGED